MKKFNKSRTKGLGNDVRLYKGKNSSKPKRSVSRKKKSIIYKNPLIKSKSQNKPKKLKNKKSHSPNKIKKLENETPYLTKKIIKLYKKPIKKPEKKKSLTNFLKNLEKKNKSQTRLPKKPSTEKTGKTPLGTTTSFPNLPQKLKSFFLPTAKSSKFQYLQNQSIYAVNTTNGIIRNYNEDRVSVVVNIKPKKGYDINSWPRLSYFSIFDGHGGSSCSDFLKNNLHRYIFQSKYFPLDIPKAIKSGCKKAEEEFYNSKNKNKSGSCGLVAIFCNNKVYIGNVGDCRIIVSEKYGKYIFPLSEDHKPNSKKEKKRILDNKGTVSQTLSNKNIKNPDLPYRVYPGGLSVSRAFGDYYAKDIRFGGNPKVLISTPDVFLYKINDMRTDFFFLGCDGIFDMLTNEDISKSIWNDIKNYRNSNIYNNSEKCEKIVNNVIKLAIKKLSCDNLTCIFIPLNLNIFQ